MRQTLRFSNIIRNYTMRIVLVYCLFCACFMCKVRNNRNIYKEQLRNKHMVESRRADIGKKKGKAKAKPLPIEVTQDEYVAILNEGKFMHHKVAFMLAFESGLRISEVVGVQKADIDEKLCQIRINMGKNSKDRIVNLPLSWRPHLIKYIPIKCKQRALQKAFIDAAEKTGLKKRKPKIHFHSLRHGFATEALRSGVDIYTISKLLGHEDISTTTIYAHLCPEDAIRDVRAKFGRRVALEGKPDVGGEK